MSIIGILRTDLNFARKERDASKVSALATLIGEISSKGKLESMPDSDVLASIRKTVKGLDEVIGIKGTEDSEKEIFEKSLLEQYLPQQLSDADLRSVIVLLISANPNKGAVMKELKLKYNGLYDGKIAASIVDELINV